MAIGEVIVKELTSIRQWYLTQVGQQSSSSPTYIFPSSEQSQVPTYCWVNGESYGKIPFTSYVLNLGPSASVISAQITQPHQIQYQIAKSGGRQWPRNSTHTNVTEFFHAYIWLISLNLNVNLNFLCDGKRGWSLWLYVAVETDFWTKRRARFLRITCIDLWARIIIISVLMEF